MRRWMGSVGLIVVLGLAYWAWPLAGAAHLASVVRGGDPAEVFALVDVDGVRRSLSRQIAAAYLDVSGKGKKLGSFGRSVAGAAVVTVADPYVAELLTPANITALLSQGRIGQVRLGDRTVAVNRTLPNVSALLSDRLLSAVTSSYFDQIKDFVIPVDVGDGSGNQYGIHMHLVGLTWMLGGVDLPPAVVDEMARAILAGDKPATL